MNAAFDPKSVKLSPTADWETWQEGAEQASLHAGENTIALVVTGADSGQVNLDHVVVPPSSQSLPAMKAHLVDNGCLEVGPVGWVDKHGKKVIAVEIVPRANSHPVCSQCHRPELGYRSVDVIQTVLYH